LHIVVGWEWELLVLVYSWVVLGIVIWGVSGRVR
jgi:hypothetical protein